MKPINKQINSALWVRARANFVTLASEGLRVQIERGLNGIVRRATTRLMEDEIRIRKEIIIRDYPDIIT